MSRNTPTTRILRNAERGLIRRFLAKPPGWDEPGNWAARMVAALVMGLVYYFVRRRF